MTIEKLLIAALGIFAISVRSQQFVEITASIDLTAFRSAADTNDITKGDNRHWRRFAS